MDVAPTAADRRSACLAALAQGPGRFHEPRRADCPWCGSPRLRVLLRSTDLLQRKPGTFTLDQCAACAHLFQNPRLTPEGRDFYRGDPHLYGAHQGLGGPLADRLLGTRPGDRRHLARALALRALDEPECWLDVGTGAARFPALARRVLPYTAFDGLDQGRGVEEAVRSGRVEEGHRGSFPALAHRLAGRYDAVSMFHHLAGSPDPREELKAARLALRPGGHLMIEATDPECRFARLLGKWWPCYAQPRHLHLMPLAGLRAELTRLGFTVVAVDRRTPHVPADLTGALALVVNGRLPQGDVPWRARPAPLLRRGLRRAGWWASVPPLALAHALDRLLSPLLTRTGFGNAYRVIARRDAGWTPAPPPRPDQPRSGVARPATTSSTCSHSAANAVFSRPSSSR
ncbi:class I SAM-dependent methyltransferase [Streptomyces alfalfae]|uniref:Class I SAM-dependent methyltransferase n=1 Tax=Streptomyces alfalfae TaxID=1642299 RepID=A0A7T4TX67_9ACTN|nr:class I SAM-dependent methyltransferase [Streptomyces alfalfae]QQC88924.1 class I SAM-dependent methyltransferase [Streptomyces alfalfae]